MRRVGRDLTLDRCGDIPPPGWWAVNGLALKYWKGLNGGRLFLRLVRHAWRRSLLLASLPLIYFRSSDRVA